MYTGISPGTNLATVIDTGFLKRDLEENPLRKGNQPHLKIKHINKYVIYQRTRLYRDIDESANPRFSVEVNGCPSAQYAQYGQINSQNARNGINAVNAGAGAMRIAALNGEVQVPINLYNPIPDLVAGVRGCGLECLKLPQVCFPCCKSN